MMRTRLLLLGAALAACSPAPPQRVVLVSIDTLRADHLGSYGHAEARTPVLDDLAARGVRFEHAIAPAPLTLPSHTTLLTGMDPPAHGVRSNAASRLDASVPTLAEHFQAAGFATAAFIGATVLDRHFGLMRGFEHYDDRMPEGHALRSRGFAERQADVVVDSALDWLDTAPERFFLWIHLYDPHAGYEPPPEYLAHFARNPYDGEIAFVDDQLARLLEGLRAVGPETESLLVVTADHGESLGEHGENSHAYFVYDATQRVPLIVQGAGVPEGRVVTTPVRLMDVAPTLVELARLEPLANAQGQSLTPLFSGGAHDWPAAYVETLAPQLNHGWSPLLGLRTAQYKYIRAPRSELYDVRADPAELRDLIALDPERAAALDAQLSERLAAARPVRTEPLPDELREKIESLGYFASDAPAGGEPGRVGGIDPKDRIQVWTAASRAMELIANDRYEQALVVLAPYEDGGPTLPVLRARALLYTGELARAEEPAGLALARAPGRAEGYYLMGIARARRGDPQEAGRLLLRAAELNPAGSTAWEALGEIGELVGDTASAEGYYQRALEARSGSAIGRARLASLYLDQQRFEEADSVLLGLPEGRTLPPKVIVRLARAEFDAGRRQQGIARLRRGRAARPGSPVLSSALQELSGSL